MGYKTFANGQFLYDFDLNLLMKQTVATFASTSERGTNIPTPVAGQMCYVTGLGVQQYYGGAWRTIYPDASVTKYQGSAAQPFPVQTWNRVNFPTSIITSGAWTVSSVAQAAPGASGTCFTCQVAGRYTVTAFIRLAAAGQGNRSISLADNVGANQNVMAFEGTFLMFAGSNPAVAADMWAATITGERDFAVGATLCLWVWQGTTAVVNSIGDYGWPHITIRRVPG